MMAYFVMPNRSRGDDELRRWREQAADYARRHLLRFDDGPGLDLDGDGGNLGAYLAERVEPASMLIVGDLSWLPRGTHQKILSFGLHLSTLVPERRYAPGWIGLDLLLQDLAGAETGTEG